jgi:hypothetical protein
MNNEYVIDERVRAKATWIEDGRQLDKNDKTLKISPYQRE